MLHFYSLSRPTWLSYCFCVTSRVTKLNCFYIFKSFRSSDRYGDKCTTDLDIYYYIVIIIYYYIVQCKARIIVRCGAIYRTPCHFANYEGCGKANNYLKMIAVRGVGTGWGWDGWGGGGAGAGRGGGGGGGGGQGLLLQ